MWRGAIFFLIYGKNVTHNFLSAISHNYVRGSITIYIINLHRSRKKIKLAGTLRNNTVHQYLLQPYGTDGLRAKLVSLFLTHTHAYTRTGQY